MISRWDGENSMEIRRRADERAQDRLAREAEPEPEETSEEVQTCACGSTEFANIADILVCRHCRRSWGPK